MKARHKDKGAIIELAEEGIISCDGRRYCLHQVELLPELVDVVQPSLPSDLDEAAEEYGRNTFINECMKYGVCDHHDLSDAFKAGADWQKEQDQETIELAEEHAMLAGRMQMKEQMMKEVVEGEVVKTFPEGIASIHYLAPAGVGEMAYFSSDNGLSIGDKVRIIIVKEEDRDG